MFEPSLGGLDFADLAGLSGGSLLVPPAEPADASAAESAPPATDAAAAAAERTADARRVIAGVLAQHADILGDADRALIGAFDSFLAGGAPGAAAGRPPSEDVRLDAMSMRGGAISGRNVLVLDWAAGVAKKLFRKGLA